MAFQHAGSILVIVDSATVAASAAAVAAVCVRIAIAKARLAKQLASAVVVIVDSPCVRAFVSRVWRCAVAVVKQIFAYALKRDMQDIVQIYYVRNAPGQQLQLQFCADFSS